MVKDDIQQLIQSTTADLGYQVYDSSIIMRGENSKIIVKIDSAAGVTLQDCEKYSRELIIRLDVLETLPNYSLEVSSPGLNRKLRTIEDFHRFTGSPVKIIYTHDDRRDVCKGVITGVTGPMIHVREEKKDVEISIDAVASANLDY